MQQFIHTVDGCQVANLPYASDHPFFEVAELRLRLATQCIKENDFGGGCFPRQMRWKAVQLGMDKHSTQRRRRACGLPLYAYVRYALNKTHCDFLRIPRPFFEHTMFRISSSERCTFQEPQSSSDASPGT